jgi:predicted  nucleic acid-binding Zn-ribbon protein
MKRQLSLLSKLQSFDNRVDTMYKAGLPERDGPRKLTKKQKQLAAERDGIAQGIGKTALGAYERMRETRLKPNAVVPVISGVCQGCYMVVTKSVIVELKRGDELVLCEHCGRILFLPDGETE